MVYILLACHLFFCVKTRFIQRHTVKGIRYSLKSNAEGSTYAAFASALGTTIGPGNIVGVAVGISVGGAGSVFWMFVCGIVAMATKYAESYLCLKYSGGPMVIYKKIGQENMSYIWAFLCILAGLFMGAAVPASALASAIAVPRWQTGLCLALILSFAIAFGIGGIFKICSFVVPIMSIGFIGMCAVVVILNFTKLPAAVISILKGAFSINAAVGGGIGLALKSGVTRGLYSNESGLGSGGVLAAEAHDPNTEKSALAAMTTAFWDTVVMCSLTGVVFVMGGADFGCDAWQTVEGSFACIPFSKPFLTVSMALFVLATILGWYCIALRCIEFAQKNTKLFSAVYVLSAALATVAPPSLLWSAADTVNFLLLIPSMYLFVRMSGKINLYISNDK